MQQILKDASVNPPAEPVVYSYTLVTRGTRTTSIHLVATPTAPNLPVRAIGWLQGSNDYKTWHTIARLMAVSTAADPGKAFDGGPFETLWEAMRFRLDVSDNCTASVFLTQREG